jgi:hypothetical protein
MQPNRRLFAFPTSPKVPCLKHFYAGNAGSHRRLFQQPKRSERSFNMPILLWALGVPFSLIIVAWLFGAF